jgi:hypothetical protein
LAAERKVVVDAVRDLQPNANLETTSLDAKEPYDLPMAVLGDPHNTVVEWANAELQERGMLTVRLGAIGLYSTQ